jgi:hypothetical protein
VEQFDVWLKRRFAETRSHGAIVRGQFGRNGRRGFSYAVSICDGAFERPGQGTDERNHVAEDRNRPPALFLGRDQLGLRVSRGSHLKESAVEVRQGEGRIQHGDVGSEEAHADADFTNVMGLLRKASFAPDSTQTSRPTCCGR